MKIEFHDLKRQYQYLKKEIEISIQEVMNSTHFIQGAQVAKIEQELANYVSVKHCITCANGTDALLLALKVWNIGKNDAVFVPDFTFFSSGEVVSAIGAVPIFVDVSPDTYNISCYSLEHMIQKTIKEGKLNPKAIIAVDLFGQPADYANIKQIANKYHLLILEDAAQGFGGKILEKRACSFGDIATTSFFPSKPLGCYGDGGAIFTNRDDWAELLRSYQMHGKGKSKYDNIRIGMNSRLDTIQAAVLMVKLPVFANYELEQAQKISLQYTELLNTLVKTPVIKDTFYSSWAQYTIQLADNAQRNKLQHSLQKHGIPSAVYYHKPMHLQQAFNNHFYDNNDFSVSNSLSRTVLSLPFHPYMEEEEIIYISNIVNKCLRG